MDERQDDDLDIRLRWSGVEAPSDTDPPRGPDGPQDERSFVAADLAADVAANAGGGSARLQPMLPAISGRLESVQGAIATFALRLDGLTASLDSLRSVLGDRLTEHMDAVARVAQSHTADIEENRHGAERLIAELRRATAANEETLRRTAARLEEVATNVDLQVELQRAAEPRDDTAITDLRRATAANEEMLRGVSVRLEELIANVDTEVDLLRSAVADPRTAKALADLRKATGANEEALRGMGTRLEEFNANVETHFDVLTVAKAEPRETKALTDLRKATAASEKALQEMSARLDGLAASVDAQLDHLSEAAGAPRDDKALADLRRLTAANEKTLREVSERLEELVTEGIARAADSPPPMPQLDGFESMMAEMRDEMMQLRRRIGLRAKASGSIADDQLEKIADVVAARLDPAGLDDTQLDRLVNTIVDRLQRVLEVVEEEAVSPPPPARRQRPPRKS